MNESLFTLTAKKGEIQVRIEIAGLPTNYWILTAGNTSSRGTSLLVPGSKNLRNKRRAVALVQMALLLAPRPRLAHSHD